MHARIADYLNTPGASFANAWDYVRAFEQFELYDGPWVWASNVCARFLAHVGSSPLQTFTLRFGTSVADLEWMWAPHPEPRKRRTQKQLVVACVQGLLALLTIKSVVDLHIAELRALEVIVIDDSDDETVALEREDDGNDGEIVAIEYDD